MVPRQRLVQPALPHDDEGDAVDDRPAFIGPHRVQVDPLKEQPLRRRDDHDAIIGAKVAQQIEKGAPMGRLFQGVSQLDQDPTRRDEAARKMGRKLDSRPMMLVARVQQREVIRDIRKDDSHSFGVP